MLLQHKFIEELKRLETHQEFCNSRIESDSNILVIGTFNPNSASCLKENNADWFYGRKSNWFWRYLPEAMGLESIHQNNGGTKDDWRKFCITEKVVIVDLIKEIDAENPLQDFKDRRINDLINTELSNISVFDFQKAFNGVKFKKVVFTRKGWDNNQNRDIRKLIKIKNSVISALKENSIISDFSDIYYCPAPWTKRQSTLVQWKNALG